LHFVGSSIGACGFGTPRAFALTFAVQPPVCAEYFLAESFERYARAILLERLFGHRHAKRQDQDH
jgi:hypothetical protein